MSATAVLGWDRVDLKSVGVDSSEVMDLHVDGLGTMWVGTWTGAASYRSGVWTAHNADRDRVVHAFTGGGSKPLWAFHDDRIARLDDNRWVRFDGSVGTVTIDKPLASSTRNGLECFRIGDSYVESADGNGVLHGVPLTPGAGLDLLLDDADVLWILADWFFPIMQFTSERLTCWDDIELWPGLSGWSGGLAQTTDGRIWAILGPGLHVHQSGAWVPVHSPDSPFLLEVFSSGELILLTFSSAWRRAGDSWEKIYETAPDVFLAAVSPDPSDGVWLSLWQRHEGRKRGHSIVLVRGSEEVSKYPYPHDEVFTLDVQGHLAATDDGAVWLGDRAGLYVVRPGQTVSNAITWGRLKSESKANGGNQTRWGD